MARPKKHISHRGRRMQFRLEKRPQPSRLMLYVTPVAALAVTAVRINFWPEK